MKVKNIFNIVKEIFGLSCVNTKSQKAKEPDRNFISVSNLHAICQYQLNHLENLQKKLEKFHPLSRNQI